MSTEITVEISDERLRDLLTSGFEGGCGYWCRIMDYREPAGPVTPALGRDRVYPHSDYPLAEGGAVVVRDCYADDETDEEYTPLVLDRTACERGLRLMAQQSPRHWADVISEHDDAITADVFIQYAVLGEIVYG